MNALAKIDIQNEDNRFQKEAIRNALGPSVQERPDRELGLLYDELSTPKVTVTTYFDAWGWYHVTSVDAAEQDDEDAFWNRLQQAVAANPRLMHEA